MITGEIKNRIDQIWDTFFVAGITNPITVLEQMTYIFFMKMLDDKQLQEEENARDWDAEVKNPTFPDGQLWVNPEAVSDEEKKGIPYENLRWHVFKNLGSDNMFRLVRQSVFEFIKHIGTGEESAYSRYMKSAIFLIPNARTLSKIVDGVDALDMNNRDAMGDVYEYILGKMAASGTNGQFRTPRHIIRMIVEMMDPKPQDYICDPAMGSAGFLVEAVKYIKERYHEEFFVSERMDHIKTSLINGFDTDQTMLRIGAMNLLLHDISSPNLAWRDSLSEQNEDKSCYTLVMANPPFAGSLDKGNINKNILAYANTTKTELLFLIQFVRSLEVGGRCASIVPDGVLFGTSKAHIAIRQEIVDRQQLRAVISMPSGVFKPYAGASTTSAAPSATTTSPMSSPASTTSRRRRHAAARSRASLSLWRRFARTTTTSPSTSIRRLSVRRWSTSLFRTFLPAWRRPRATTSKAIANCIKCWNHDPKERNARNNPHRLPL